jgi:hypothetical protein
MLHLAVHNPGTAQRHMFSFTLLLLNRRLMVSPRADLDRVTEPSCKSSPYHPVGDSATPAQTQAECYVVSFRKISISVSLCPPTLLSGGNNKAHSHRRKRNAQLNIPE